MTQQQPESSSGLGGEHAEKLRRSYLNFRWPLFLLRPEEHTRPCLESGWSPIAAAAHIAYWDRYQLQRMQAAVNPEPGEPVPVPVETNDERAASESRSWEAVLAEADEAREALILFALSLSDEQIEAEYVDRGKSSRIVKQLLERMPQHVDEHAKEVHQYCFALERWGRARLFEFYRRHFNSLLDAITGLTEESCITVPVCGRWTVRDLLCHILAWDQFILELIKRWPDASMPELRAKGSGKGAVDGEDDFSQWMGEDVDSVNARLQGSRAELTMIEVLDGLATCHRRIIGRCRKLSDEELCTEVEYDRGESGNVVNLLVSMSAHTADHAAEIYAARAAGKLVPLRLKR